MKSIYIIGLLLLLTTLAHAQQEAQFTQFVFNKLAFNPAYAGSKDATTLAVVGRRQWVNMDGAPRTELVSLQGPVRGKRLGLGMMISNDRIGVTRNTNVQLAYSYRLVYTKKQVLSFGIQNTFNNFSINWDDTQANQLGDNAIPTGTTSAIRANVGFGAYYANDRFFAGFSVPNLIENNVMLVSSDPVQAVRYPQPIMHSYYFAGAIFQLSAVKDKLVLQPSVLIKQVQDAPYDLDINAFLVFNQALWLGLTYQHQDAIDGLLMLQMSKQWRIGLSYGYTLSALERYNAGSVEVMIEYNFLKERSNLLNPRHFYF